MNTQPRIIALTGGIACGKSLVLSILKKKGLRTLSSDQLAREVVAPRSKGLEQVVAHFGKEYLSPSGALDRKKLGTLVFGDASRRKELEAIVHPLIREQASADLARMKSEDSKSPIFYEIPLFFETGFKYPDIDAVVVVYCPEKLSLERLQERDGLTETEANLRIRSQLDIEVKQAKADYVIENTSDIVALERQVDSFLEHLST